jgi:hypothetical protein
MHQAVDRVQQLCLQKGKDQHFQIFATYYLATRCPRPTWQEVAVQMGLRDGKAASAKADWVKSKLAEAVRSEIHRHVGSDDEVDDELRSLLG